jgi:hypothetical protein
MHVPVGQGRISYLDLTPPTHTVPDEWGAASPTGPRPTGPQKAPFGPLFGLPRAAIFDGMSAGVQKSCAACWVGFLEDWKPEGKTAGRKPA